MVKSQNGPNENAERQLIWRVPHQLTSEYIKSEIAYESKLGAHTYHDCECGRSSCRSNCCINCLNELLEYVKNYEIS